MKRHVNLKTREAVAGYIFAMPSLLGFGLFFLAPFGVSLWYCFTDGIGTVRFVGMKNFRDLLASKSFLLASQNTLLFNLISVPLIIVVSFLLAQLLSNRIKGVSYFRSFFILPLVIPVASVILVWQIVFDMNGALNILTGKFAIAPVDWLRSDWSVGVLTLIYVWKNCGYNVVLFLAAINSIPKEYYESARIDGAGDFTCLTKITIPFVIPMGFFVLIMSVINSLKVFREAYLLAGSYPYLRIYQLQHFMNNIFYNLSYQRLSTAAFLMFTAVSALVLVLFKIQSRYGRYME
jgi:multiple sugar transport system permease protein